MILKIPERQNKSEIIRIRVTPRQKDYIVKTSNELGLSVSSFILQLVYHYSFRPFFTRDSFLGKCKIPKKNNDNDDTSLTLEEVLANVFKDNPKDNPKNKNLK